MDLEELFEFMIKQLDLYLLIMKDILIMDLLKQVIIQLKKTSSQFIKEAGNQAKNFALNQAKELFKQALLANPQKATEVATAAFTQVIQGQLSERGYHTKAKSDIDLDTSNGLDDTGLNSTQVNEQEDCQVNEPETYEEIPQEETDQSKSKDQE